MPAASQENPTLPLNRDVEAYSTLLYITNPVKNICDCGTGYTFPE